MSSLFRGVYNRHIHSNSKLSLKVGVSLLLLCIGLMSISPIKAATLTLSSLNWPPYTGEQILAGGASVEVVRAALKAVGHDLKVDYYPWSRTIRIIKPAHSIYSGYFPEYHFPSDEYVFSDPIGVSPVALIEQQQFPIRWSNVKDLNQYRLGVVHDYQNTLELDAMIASGMQPVEKANSDEHNIQKVATGRIQGAVIDKYVFNYLIKQTHLSELHKKIQLNKQLLETRTLHIAFKNTAEGREWRQALNKGLKMIDKDKIVQQYLSTIE
ncbi:ABC transporter substrate-binding protein [Shewanella sp. Isolate11]|uniref:substrate-binding periplasmic protein n=1 Tax=Shewanella sp. Isolate11 TaxID=2908530 RepID=UPI001EFC86CA|nr:ABC transporter substrate-binding protein [Shewanella sp. Isolate11]MCG9696804.1 ABC transporter substrate-binding protein [Shewanella sp. Isolate11]